jgi:predicted nucleic acid-binding protein
MIYLDSCVLIYLIEGKERRRDEVGHAMVAAGTAFSISPMVKCECLVGPIKLADLRLRQRYLTLFAQFVSLALPEEVYLQAAELRGRFSLRTPDALHLACAQHHGCEALWTNDGRFARASHGMARSLSLRD